MGKPYQIGVRFTDEQRAELEHIQKLTKLDLADIIRYAVDALIEHYHRCGNKLVLPIDFAEVVEAKKSPDVQKNHIAKAA